MIGWAVDDHMRTELVQAAVAMAVVMRGELAGEVILHADRGTPRRSSRSSPVTKTWCARWAVPRLMLGQRCGRILLGYIES